MKSDEGAVGEGFGDVLAVAVVEEDGSAGLGEADDLLVDGCLKQSALGLRARVAASLGGALLDGLGIVGDALHGGEVVLDTLLLEGGFVEVGVGADEEAGARLTAERRVLKSPPVCGATNMRACSAPSGTVRVVPSMFFLSQVSISVNQLSGGLIGGAAQEGHDDEQMVGLGAGEVGFDPDLVAGLQAGDLRDGKGAVAAGDADVDLRAEEVETRCVGGMEAGVSHAARRQAAAAST